MRNNINWFSLQWIACDRKKSEGMDFSCCHQITIFCYEWVRERERERDRERERESSTIMKVLIIKWCIQYWRDLWCVELLVDFDEYAHYMRFLWKTCKHCAYVIATKIQNIRLLFIWSLKAHCMIRLSVVIVNVSVAFISLKL